VFLTVVERETYSLLCNLLAPEMPASKTLAIMKDHVVPKSLIIAERFQFHQRCQGEAEDVTQYMADLWRLADECDFGNYLEQALRDWLVCGLCQESIGICNSEKHRCGASPERVSCKPLLKLI